MISHLRGGLEDPRKVQSIDFDEKIPLHQVHVQLSPLSLYKVY